MGGGLGSALILIQIRCSSEQLRAWLTWLPDKASLMFENQNVMSPNPTWATVTKCLQVRYTADTLRHSTARHIPHHRHHHLATIWRSGRTT
ncbi:hypothetical protein F4801DRAFT_231155 [Xylaria longipes]|nr:hypothetical protein F4801DRAFT_231155 [Xylaria longipes]